VQDLSKITIKSLIGKKVLFILVAIFIVLTVGLSEIFIHDHMFEKFVNFTREHEDWDLDEYILVFISIMIALSISLFIASTILIKKLTALTKAHIEQEQNLAHSRKLQSMGTLLGGLAHSLNNHLVPIQTISKILQEDNDSSSQTYMDASKIHQASQSARGMLRKVLNFTRQEHNLSGNCCIVDETVIKTIDLFQSTIPSSITLKRDIPALPLSINVSSVNIEIILLNLLTNAVDAIEESDKKSKQIDVTLSNEIQNDVNFVILAVKDTGSGISQEAQQKIFDPFYTSKATNKGSGLGLSETYGIIHEAGGFIEVDTQIGKYTNMKLYIPISKITT